FSAAASPGNSGGPLVDERGRVIGVVLRKSPAENLNMALPIGELVDAKENEGVVSGRIPVRLPIFDESETLKLAERFELPQPLAQFYTTVHERTVRAISAAQQKLLEDNSNHLFPRGAGSEQLLHTIERTAFPRVMHEDPNKVWVTNTPQLETV